MKLHQLIYCQRHEQLQILLEVCQIRSRRPHQRSTTQRVSDSALKSNQKYYYIATIFISAISQEKINSLPETHIRMKNEISEIKIRIEGVEKLLKKPNPSKTPGPEKMTIQGMRTCVTIMYHIPFFIR